MMTTESMMDFIGYWLNNEQVHVTDDSRADYGTFCGIDDSADTDDSSDY